MNTKMHSDCNFSECYCYDCPYRYCHHEDDMYIKLVNQSKYQIKYGLYWISIGFEYNDTIALRAFERYKEWLKAHGFEGTTPSYKTWIAYRDDKTPAVDCGYHQGTFYFHKIEKEKTNEALCRN